MTDNDLNNSAERGDHSVPDYSGCFADLMLLMDNHRVL